MSSISQYLRAERPFLDCMRVWIYLWKEKTEPIRDIDSVLLLKCINHQILESHHMDTPLIVHSILSVSD